MYLLIVYTNGIMKQLSRHLKILFLFLCCMPVSHAIEQLEVQGLFSGKAVINIDGKMHVLSIGEISPEGVKVISADSRSAVLEIDGQHKSYQLGNTIHTNFEKPEFVREQIFADVNGMYLTYGNINGHQVRFLVDTGATTVAMSSQKARQLGIAYRLDGAPLKASTASGIAEGWGVTLKSIKVGKIKQTNVPAMVIDGDHPRHILLGMTFLENLKVTKEGDKLVLEEKK